MTDLTPSPSDPKNEIDDAEVIEQDSPEASVDETSEQPPLKPKTVKTGLLWFFTIINFLVIALICAAGYWYYTQIASPDINKQNDINAIDQRLTDKSSELEASLRLLKQGSQNVESNIASVKQAASQDLASVEGKLKQDLSKVEQELTQDLAKVETELSQELSSMQGKLDLVSATADTMNKRIAELVGRRPSDWLLAEANYLVNMAGRKLYLEKDVSTAVTLLKEADGRLQDLNDPSLFPVRALISSDIQALSQLNPVSTNSVALEIYGLLTLVKDLPLDTLQLPEFKNQEDLTLSEDVSQWRQNLDKTWRSVVNDLISIDYVDQPLEPYIAKRQQWLIEQQLNHALTQAQSAALNEQLALYSSAIQRATAMVLEHYETQDTKVEQFLAALQELQNIDFSRQIPTSLASQASLKSIIDQRIENLYNNAGTSDDNTLGDQL